MRKLVVLAAVLAVGAGCKKQPKDAAATGSGSGAASGSSTARSGAGSDSGAGSAATGAGTVTAAAGSDSGSGAGSSSGSGSAAPADPDSGDADPYAELPTAVETDAWKLEAGFGDSPSVFDPTDEILASFALQVTDAKGASLWRKATFAAIVPGVDPPRECEELRVVAEAQTWGEAKGALVSLFCVNGEDYKQVSEIAILLAIDAPAADKIRILWAGAGGGATNEMDACMTSTTITYALAGTTLTKSIVDEVERGDGAPKSCKARKKKSTETVQLPAP